MKRLKCSYCEQDFGKTEHLKRHERSHRKERPYKCSDCDKSYSRSDTLLRHRRTHHLNFNSRSLIRLSTNSPSASVSAYDFISIRYEIDDTDFTESISDLLVASPEGQEPQVITPEKLQLAQGRVTYRPNSQDGMGAIKARIEERTPKCNSDGWTSTKDEPSAFEELLMNSDLREPVIGTDLDDFDIFWPRHAPPSSPVASLPRWLMSSVENMQNAAFRLPCDDSGGGCCRKTADRPASATSSEVKHDQSCPSAPTTSAFSPPKLPANTTNGPLHTWFRAQLDALGQVLSQMESGFEKMVEQSQSSCRRCDSCSNSR